MEKATGLSRGTISRAFNNSNEIKPETRDIVLKKAEEIGYVPNSGARTMKFGKTHKRGLLLPDLQNPYINQLAEALDHQAQQRNTKLVVGFTHYNARAENGLLKMWLTGEVDAIIATSSGSEDNYHTYVQAQARNFPVVFLYCSPKREFDYVEIETYASVERALNYLYDMGHRHIGYLGHQHNFARTTLPYRAYESFHKEHGLKFREDYTHFGPLDTVAAEAWDKWKQAKNRPTAMFCIADGIAIALIHEIVASGARVPQDFAVIGNDDIAAAGRMGLTTVRVDPTAFASAVAALIERPRGEGQAKTEFRIIRSEFILRQSVAKAASAK